MTDGKVTQNEAEADALQFVLENDPLLERATPATLHRIILHGGEIASKLSDEVVAEMGVKEKVLNEVTHAINESSTSPARIQELEEERMRVQAQESTKQETFEALSDVIQRAITLRQEREDLSDEELSDFPLTPLPTDHLARKSQVEPRRTFWQRLFGG